MDIGINMSGAEANFNGGYRFPTNAELDYFAAQGMNTIRLPLSWELLQPKLGGPLNSTYLAQMQSAVAYANSLGMKVILDIHNYGSYGGNLVGSAQVPVSAFADMWGKLAAQFSGNGNVLFGLMNEPQVKTASAWLPAVNAAIGAIRSAGASSQEILISGVGWDGGATWTTNGNASVLGAPGAIVDPAHNYAFEVHQYLDADASGTSSTVVSTSIGVQRLQAITAWAQATGNKLYLGETGVASDATSLAALDNMLTYMKANSAVWQGADYWAARSDWNSSYIYSAEPTLGLLDKAQMSVLEHFTNLTVVTTAVSGGDTRKDYFAANGMTEAMSDLLAANGVLVARTLYDANGAVDSSISFASTGVETLTSYANDAANTIETMNAQHLMLSKTTLSANGAAMATFYNPATSKATQTQTFAANGALTSQTLVHADGSYTIYQYAVGALSLVAQYSAAGVLTLKTVYNSAGQITAVQKPLANGAHEQENYTPGQAKPISIDIYNSDWSQLLTRTTYGANGASETDTYANGKLVSVVKTATGAAPPSADVLTIASTASGTACTTTIANPGGGRIVDQYASGELTTAAAYEASGNLVSKTTYNASGQIATLTVGNTSGGSTVSSYANGANAPFQVATYDCAGTLVARTTTAADGTYEVDAFAPGGAIRIEKYAATGVLTLTQSNDGHGVVDTVLWNADGSENSEARIDAVGQHTTHFGIANKGYTTQTVDASPTGATLDIRSQNIDGSETVAFGASQVSLDFDNAHERITSAGNETMSFAATAFQDTIVGFQGGNAAGHDTIVLSKAFAADFSHLSITAANGAATVTIDAQHSFNLTGLKGALSTADFRFI